MKLIFCLQKNVKYFFKLTVLFKVCVASHAQITQKNTFSIFLQYLKKEMNDEVDFLHADRDENNLQTDTMIFDGDGQAFPKFPREQVCNIFTIS